MLNFLDRRRRSTSKVMATKKVTKSRQEAKEQVIPLRRSKRLSQKGNTILDTDPVVHHSSLNESALRGTSSIKTPTRTKGTYARAKQGLRKTKPFRETRPNKSREVGAFVISSTTTKKQSIKLAQDETRSQLSVKVKRSCSSSAKAITSRNTSVGPDKRSSDMKIQCQHIGTFSTVTDDNYLKAGFTKFTDVLFLDESHVLACGDFFFETKSGYNRVCCFRLDGTLICEIQLPGEPWTIVVLSPTEAVVTIKHTEARGLVWLSVDIESGTMQITKTVPMDNDAFGISYNSKDKIFAVSHNSKTFITLLNRDGATVGKVPVTPYFMYRCLFVGKDILCVNYLDSIEIVDLEGRLKLSFAQTMLQQPIDIDVDVRGNFYVARHSASSSVCLFNSRGKYVCTLLKCPLICGIGLSKMSDKMAVAHGKCISVYRLQTSSNY